LVTILSGIALKYVLFIYLFNKLHTQYKKIRNCEVFAFVASSPKNNNAALSWNTASNSTIKTGIAYFNLVFQRLLIY